jgi:TolB-like protein
MAAVWSRTAVPEDTDQLARLNATLVARYRVERELGRGGMATVWLAQDLKHDRPVALKVLHPEFAAALGPERFLREVRITARLNHPHILALLDSGETDGIVYYAMPYVEGESLRDRLIREKQLRLDDALQIAREVADALSYAHAHGVIHRDIKPENILLESGHAVVADFGIARAISAAGSERLTQTGMAVGTPAYMSPEQAAGSRDLDGRSDLYSLGCVLYEMLAGHPPFTGTTAQEILARHSVDAVPQLTAARPTVPVAVERAIHTVLAKVPADRFATADQLADELRLGANLVTGDGFVGWGRRARWLVLGAAVVVGIVLAVWTAIPPQHTNSRVIVMPFENRTGDTSLAPLGRITADWVTEGLTQPGFLLVLDTRDALAAERTLGAGATAVAVGRETGAGVVVSGSYFFQGDSLEFQARIVSAADGTILQTIGGIVAARERPLVGADQLRQHVLAAIASLQDKDVAAFQAGLAQPPTYAAYREYTEGLENYMRIDYPEAERHFERAAFLDSNFLTARIWAAQSALWTESGMASHILARLQPLRNQLSPFEHARLDFVTALQDPGFDLEGAYRAALRMVDAAPGSVDAQREAALSALRVFRPREALRRLESLDPRRGLMREWVVYWSGMAWANHMLGKYQDELADARRERELFPSRRYFQVRIHELRALAALGRVSELDSMVRADFPTAPDWDWPGKTAYYLAGELLAHGHPEAARRLARYEGEQLTTHPAPDSTGKRGKDEWLAERAELALFLGDTEAAANLVAQFRYPEEHGWLLARILATQGRGDAARATLEEAKRHAIQTAGPLLHGLEIDEAGVLVRLGDLDDALQVLGRRRGDPIFLGTTGEDGHGALELVPLWSDPRFQALIKPRG